MNNLMFDKVNFKSKARQYFPLNNDKRFKSSKRTIRKKFLEIRPLISPDSDSCSDDEITLHDIRHVKNLNDGLSDANSLRKINKNKSLVTNGDILENVYHTDPFQDCELFNLKVEEGDTLQSISIKYHCSIADIKRANNLMSNQEFFGLKYVKIPVKKHSLLTEILCSSPTVNRESTSFEEETESNIRVINIGIGHVGRCPSPEETATFFKRMDEDLVKIMLSTQTQKESLEAAAVALTSPQIQPLVKDPYNTVDCGIQWNYLLLLVIILAIVVPAVIIYMRSSHANHQDVYSSSSSNESFTPVSKISIKSKS